MLFVSQHDFPGVSFSIQSDSESEQLSYKSIEKAGCGICAMMMVIEQLKSHSLQIQEAVRIAEKCGSTKKGYVDNVCSTTACFLPPGDPLKLFSGSLFYIQGIQERRTDPAANEGGHAFIRQIPAQFFVIDIVISHGFLLYDNATISSSLKPRPRHRLSQNSS